MNKSNPLNSGYTATKMETTRGPGPVVPASGTTIDPSVLNPTPTPNSDSFAPFKHGLSKFNDAVGEVDKIGEGLLLGQLGYQAFRDFLGGGLNPAMLRRFAPMAFPRAAGILAEGGLEALGPLAVAAV